MCFNTTLSTTKIKTTTATGYYHSITSVWIMQLHASNTTISYLPCALFCSLKLQTRAGTRKRCSQAVHVSVV